MGKDNPSLFIVDTVGEHRGMHYYNFPLADQLCRIGVEVTLISTPETIDHPLLPANIDSQGIFSGIYGEHSKVVRGVNYAWALLKLYRLCLRKKPEIIHFHFFQIPLLDLGLIYLINLSRTSIVISIHDVVPISKKSDLSTSNKSVFNLIYKNSTGLVVHTQYTKDILLDLEQSLDEKVIIIPHANYSYFIDQVNSYTSVQTKDGKILNRLPEEAKILLVFGTIKQNKRLDWVIQALSLIADKYPEAHLVIVGKPQDRDVNSDIAYAENLGLSDRVHWRIEKASDEELVQYFSIADITLFPYDYIYQSGAIIMALNFAKPVIATSVGSNLEIIQDNKTGLLVKPNDPQSFAFAISSLLADSEKAAKLGRAGLNYVSKKLSWENIAGEYAEFYRSQVVTT
jgi:glycosyltransferase involved in cell wall biosynthesis